MSRSDISSSSGRPEDCLCDYPYKKKHPIKFEGQSTNKAAYKPYNIQKPVQYQVPKINKKSYDPELLQTSYKSQYKQPDPKITNNSEEITNYQYKPNKAQFYSDTEYKKSFQPSQIVIEKQPEYVYKPKDTKFEGVTTYGSQFKAIKVGNSDLVNAGQESLSYMNKKPKIAFEGKTSYQETFTKYDVKVQKQPQYKYQPKDTKFSGQSSYKTSFQKYPDNAYKNNNDYCPIHPQRIVTKIK